MDTARIGELADTFLLALSKDFHDGMMDQHALGVASVRALADYADLDTYYTQTLGDAWRGSPALTGAVTREVDRRLSARGHHDEIPAPVTDRTAPHASGFDRGFGHATISDGEVSEDARPDDSDRETTWTDAQWDAYVDGWIEGAGAYETYGGHGIGGRLADGRYYECVHRAL